MNSIQAVLGSLLAIEGQVAQNLSPTSQGQDWASYMRRTAQCSIYRGRTRDERRHPHDPLVSTSACLSFRLRASAQFRGTADPGPKTMDLYAYMVA